MDRARVAEGSGATVIGFAYLLKGSLEAHSFGSSRLPPAGSELGRIGDGAIHWHQQPKVTVHNRC